MAIKNQTRIYINQTVYKILAIHIFFSYSHSKYELCIHVLMILVFNLQTKTKNLGFPQNWVRLFISYKYFNGSNKYYWLFCPGSIYYWLHCPFYVTTLHISVQWLQSHIHNVSSTVSFRGASTLEIVGPSGMTFVRCFAGYTFSFSVEKWSTCAKTIGTLNIIHDKL